MAFTLYTLIQTAILCINAIAVLHEERFLSKMGWGADQGVGGFGDDPGVKAQILNLIRSVRTVMRGGVVVNSGGYRVLQLLGERICDNASWCI
uniref:Immediate early response 3-interacting protein 1 n=1 Tax=Cyprinodon variegatus TaxID=28743 RepID=A0A3Q2FE87_CYPVA